MKFLFYVGFQTKTYLPWWISSCSAEIETLKRNSSACWSIGWHFIRQGCFHLWIALQLLYLLKQAKEKKKSSSHYLFILFTYQGVANKSSDCSSTTRQMRNLQPRCPAFKIKKAMTNIKILMILCNYGGSPVISN